MTPLIAAFFRELRLAWSGGGGAALPLGFFFGAASLVPLALGPEAQLLKAAGPGIIWIAFALSSLLPMERLFQADLEDGTLDALAGSGVSLAGVALAKTLAHWLATGAPLALASPLIWLMLQGPESAVLVSIPVGLAGSAAFFFFGSIGASLAAGVRRGGLLIALVALPLFAPAMIFGAATLYAAAAGAPVRSNPTAPQTITLDLPRGLSDAEILERAKDAEAAAAAENAREETVQAGNPAWMSALLLTLATALFAVAIAPFAAAAALRAAID